MLSIFPLSADLSNGFHTPIIAFEFSRNMADLSFLSGTTESAIANRQMMVDGHYWDMFFPVAYASLLFLTLTGLALQRNKLAFIGMPFALATIPFDWHENLILLAIIEDLSALDIITDSLFSTLYIATWLKWACIAIALSFISIIYCSNNRRLAALLCSLSGFSAVACFALNSPGWAAEIFSLAATCGLLTVFILSIIDLGEDRGPSQK